MLEAATTLELLQKVESKNLYLKLIQQLNKDYQLANIDEVFLEETTPVQLHKKITTSLLNLMNSQYDHYLNLLYRIDISESQLLKVKNQNLEVAIQEVAFIVLQREVQKVWLKAHYGK
jgi:hypothetical protein